MQSSYKFKQSTLLQIEKQNGFAPQDLLQDQSIFYR